MNSGKTEVRRRRIEVGRRLWCGCLFSALCLLFSVLRPPASAESATIKEITVTGLYSISDNELLDLLDLSTGAPLDRARLRTGIKRAFLKGIFEDIIVEGADGDAVIRVTVKEKRIIDSIRIKGNEYLSRGFIGRALDIREGERFSGLRLRNGTRDLINEMQKKGFPHAGVSYDTVPGKANRATLSIDVKEGSPEIVRKIEISGNDESVRSHLELSEGDIFDLGKMDRLRAGINRYYRRQSYIGTALTYTFDRGALRIELDRGKKLNISFEGNVALQSGTLMKEMPFFEINDFSDELVEETTARIISLYHRNGYPFAQAAPVITRSDNEISLDFFLFEGDRYTVGEVSFEGVTVPPERLREMLILRAGAAYNPDALEADTETLSEFYRALGYLYMEIGEPDVKMAGNTAEVTYSIKEGPQALIGKITVAGNDHVSGSDVLKAIPIRPGSPYNEVDISESKRKILELYAKHGFLDTTLSVDSEISGASANVTFRLAEGGVTRFGKDIIIGNERTKRVVIRREFMHRENDPLNYGLFMEERQKLYRLGLFNDVEIELAEKQDDERDVIYRLREANAGAVEFGLGYGEFEKLRGFVDVSYRNLWGMNRQASFRTELSTLEQRFILSYSEPWFLGRELMFKSLLLQEKRKEENIDTKETSFRLRRTAFSSGIEKKVSDRVKAELYYDFSVVKTFDVKPDVVLSREDVGTLVISGLRPGFIYDSRDNPFEPRSGVLAGISLKAASAVFFSQTDFNKLTGYINWFRGLSRRIVLAVSLRAGLANGYGDTRELPIVERFFLGGRTTVRGYEQDTLGPKGKDGTPTGGNAFAMENLEFRTDIGRGFGLVTFLDGGNVWRKIGGMDLADIKYTTGLGLRYNTPVGPFRVDYGYKLNREKGESRGAVHFSLGHAF